MLDGLYYFSDDNRKTGRVVGVAIGRTQQETMQSCAGCKQLDEKNCYAWTGTPRLALLGQHHALEDDPTRYSLDKLLKHLDGPRVVRFGTIGDPARIHEAELRRALLAFTKRGFVVIGYTHHWRRPEHAWLRKWFMASCDNPDEVAQAQDLGWRATAIVPHNFRDVKTVVAGSRAIVCPAQTKGLTCVECRLCAVHNASPRAPKVILFRDHGPKARRLRTV